MKLLGKIKTLQPYRRSSWIDAVPAATRHELDELKDVYKKGELQDASGAAPSLRQVYDLAVRELKLSITFGTFTTWLRS